MHGACCADVSCAGSWVNGDKCLRTGPVQARECGDVRVAENSPGEPDPGEKRGSWGL